MAGAASTVKVLLAGDTNGRFDSLFARVDKVNRSNGPFDLLLCVGRFFDGEGPEDVDFVGSLQPYLEGTKRAPVPTYFIGGWGHGSSIAIEKLRQSSECGIQYLGRRGLVEIKGLRIAHLDGIYNPVAYSSEEESQMYYNAKDVAALNEMINKSDGDLDLLLTNDWPEGIFYGCKSVPEQVENSPMSPHLADLAVNARPRYHIAGTQNMFYARLPYINSDRGAGTHVTRFISIGAVGNQDKQKWIHALGMVPCASMSVEQFSLIPPDATGCPYTGQAKRGLEDDDLGEQSWRWQKHKKRQKVMAAPSLGRKDIVKDRSKTIFVRNVPFSATEEELLAFFGNAGQVVDIVRRANQDGKLNTYCHVQFNTKEEMEKACQLNETELMGRQLFIEPAAAENRKKVAPVDGCWFCLSNSNADVNLVCSVGEESYVALDKGAITEDHVLIIPVEHYACTLDLPESTSDEITRYMSALKSYYASQGKSLVGFERYMRLRKSGGNHCHVNVVGVPLKEAARAKHMFEDAGNQLGHSFTIISGSDEHESRSSMRDIVGDGEYFTAILPDGSRLVHPIAYGAILIVNASNIAACTSFMGQVKRFGSVGERHPLSFGRAVLANLVGKPERADWKNCKVRENQEIQMAEAFKAKFKKYDIMFD